MRHHALFAGVALLSACATSSDRPRLGDITLQPYGNLTAPQTTFSVQQGRILSPDLDLSVQPDGCIRGTVGTSPFEVCNKGSVAPLKEGAEKVEHWQGPGGDFVVELEDRGTRLRADGTLIAGRGNGVPLQVTLALGQGPQWDEIRKNPALLAAAAAVAGVRGEPDRNAVGLTR
jgi:hypothetical protein